MFTTVSIIAVLAVLWSLLLMYTLGKKGEEIQQLKTELYIKEVKINQLMNNKSN